MIAFKRDAGLPVLSQRRPFGQVEGRSIAFAPRMPTIAEIVADTDLPAGFASYGEARINDVLIPRALWHLTRPRYRPGVDLVVSLTVPMRGRGGGGGGGGGADGGGGARKNPIALVASIAVLLVAAAVSGGALAGLLGAAFASGSIGAVVAGAAVGIAGSLAIAALVPPPTLATPLAAPETPTASAAQNASTSSTNPSAAALTGNILSPGTPMPRVVGTMRLYPPLLCNPLIEVVGDLEYAEAVFGLAGAHALTDGRVGDTAIASITEIEAEYVEGKPGDAVQTLVERQSFTADVSAELSKHLTDATTQYNLADQVSPAACVPQPQPGISRNAPDELWINFQWPEGLFHGDDTTIVMNQAVRVRFRRRGDTDWINAPEIHFSMNKAGAFQKVIRLVWDDFPAAPNTPPSNQGPVHAFKHVAGQNGTTVTPATADWDAHASFSSGAGNDLLSTSTLATSHVLNTELFDDKVIFYLDAATFPQGTYEFEATASSAYKASDFTASSYQHGGSVKDFFNYYLSSGSYRIPQDPAPVHDRLVLTRVSSIWNDNPVQSTEFATMSIRVHSRSLQRFSILASGYVKDWDGTGWNTYTTTSNPAPQLRDAMAGPLCTYPIPASIILDDELADWRQECIDQGYTVNAVIEGKTQADVMTMIAAAGYARVRHNEKWGVFVDRDTSADTPAQIFSPRNMTNFQWTRAFAVNPSGIRANFVDASDNYNTAGELIVYADPSAADANRLSQVSYDGLVYPADIEKRAGYDLKQPKFRFAFYQGEIAIESIKTQRGDLVGVQHDTITRRAGAARIVEVVIAGGNVTGLILDGTVPVATYAGISATAHLADVPHLADLGHKTGIAIRLKQDAGLLVKEITATENGNVTDVEFVTPFADPGAELAADCLASVGPLGTEYRRMKIFGVEPGRDLQATVTFVDEAPEIWPL
jgi:hypothetical protein